MSRANLILTHGAGAPIESDFMQNLAAAITKHGINVLLFNFSYMQKQIDEGKKRPPSRAPILEKEFLQQLDRVSNEAPLFISGKSMGGRIATHLLSMEQLNQKVKGGIVFGYPFHPPGKPDKLRTDHLVNLPRPLLILQGERDTFGNRIEVGAMALSRNITIRFFNDGDHSLKPRKTSGFTLTEHIDAAAIHTAEFIDGVIANHGK